MRTEWGMTVQQHISKEDLKCLKFYQIRIEARNPSKIMSLKSLNW
jgi:hypothetical protein